MSELGSLADLDDDVLREKLAPIIGSLLVGSRWFADKNLGDPQITVIELGRVVVDAGLLLLTIVEARFETGDSRYFVPLLATRRVEPVDAAFAIPGYDALVADAVIDGFATWLVQAVEHQSTIAMMHGRILADRVTPLSAEQCRETGVPSRAEQSNSSILYKTMIAKVYRRLSPGINPDVEVGAFLAARREYTATPRLLGSLRYQAGNAEFTLAMLQEKIIAPRDGWTILLDALQNHLPPADTIGAELGVLTAQMHLAMSEGGNDAAFEPGRTRDDDISLWQQSTMQMLETVRAGLSRLDLSDDRRAGPLVARFLSGDSYFENELLGYGKLIDRPLIRVHGDYHLGQVLLDQQDKWWIVDFEGEPRRPIADRVRKTSPLKDVAGMLRSFAYASSSAMSTGGAEPDVIRAWEAHTRRNFVIAYLKTIREKRTDLLPAEDADVQIALRSWELDKALYEVEYELSSRPDWLWVPLTSIVAALPA